MDEITYLENMSDYHMALWLYQNFLQNMTCTGQGGCEADSQVGWVQYILDLVLIPSVGAIGVVGNLVSILVLGLTDDKTTFKHVISKTYIKLLQLFKFWT